MSLEPKSSRYRHIAKTLTWRIIGTLDTILIAWIVSGNVRVGATIGGVEIVTKMILYYFHERAWFRYGQLGRKKSDAE